MANDKTPHHFTKQNHWPAEVHRAGPSWVKSKIQFKWLLAQSCSKYSPRAYLPLQPRAFPDPDLYISVLAVHSLSVTIFRNHLIYLCGDTWYLDKPRFISCRALHLEFGDTFHRSLMMRTKVSRKLFKQRSLALRSPTEPQLSTCSLTVLANWVFSAKQETMYSVVNCLFSRDVKINLPMTKRAQQTTSQRSWVFLALTFNRCVLEAGPSLVEFIRRYWVAGISSLPLQVGSS